MYKIVKREVLIEGDTELMEVYAPRIAKRINAGNFIMLRISEKGEKIPMSIFDYDRKKGTVTIIFKIIGKTTKELSCLKEGDSLLNFLGPLGKSTDIEKFGTVVCIGGGIGTVPFNPICRDLKKAGNKVISILGARNKDLLILEKEIGNHSNELYIATDDGTKGQKGFVTDVLKKLIDDGVKIDRVIAIGPIIMMKFVSQMTKPYGIKTIVSLNPIMVDGTGMCGCCRLTIGNETKFGCVDGPDFDGHLVDFDNLMLRNNRFLAEEKEASEHGGGECACKKGKA
ncbi:MAG: sulfide/dihydroorotate dehydrogenase-like FAD/NAD-binding protein [Candidatus Aenigmarchaeota archaeon]|nr:sulfide/dihydroorotate dehydrogenase-like FAD/NAD-binding protein [Candidatus Aenigmarchaeota archaeon]